MIFFVGLLLFIVGLAIGAALLMLACKIVRTDVPSLGRGMWVVFVVFATQFALTLLWGLILRSWLMSGGMAAIGSLGNALGLLLTLVNFAVAAAVYWKMLTLDSYWWALLLNLVHSILGLILAVLVVAGLLVAGLGGSIRVGDWAPLGGQAEPSGTPGVPAGYSTPPAGRPIPPPPREAEVPPGTIYKWKDRQGRMHFADHPPEEGVEYEVLAPED